MNVVCPGFMAHHVKPNRCRRCFRDINDHNKYNEISTSFTVPLPRRRRESVAVTEAPKPAEPVSDSSTTASFTVTETSSLDRRTRQRSASTSSWFQEKKDIENQKEKVDSIFRNAEDSGVTYRITLGPTGRDQDNEGEQPERVRRRNRLQQDEEEGLSISVRPPVYRQRDSDANSKWSGDQQKDTANSDFKPPLPEKVNKTSDSRTKLSTLNDSRGGPGATQETKSHFEKPGDVRLKSTKATAAQKEEGKSEPALGGKSVQSRFPLSKTMEAKPQDIPKHTETKAPSKFSEIRSLAMKFDNVNKESPKPKPWETKATENKVSDKSPTRMTSQTESQGPKSTGKGVTKLRPWETKSSDKDTAKTKPWEIKTQDNKASDKDSDTKDGVKLRPWESRKQESEKESLKLRPWESKTTTSKSNDLTSKSLDESKNRDTRRWGSKVSEPVKQDSVSKDKPVLRRVSSLREESKPKVVVRNDKAKTSSSSEESEDESEESSESSSSDKKSRVKIVAAKEVSSKKTSQNASSPDVAFVVKVKPPPIINQRSVDLDGERDAKAVKELQTTLDKLRTDLRKSEDKVRKLESEKGELVKKKSLSEKERETLDKTATDLSKMRTKIGELQKLQDEVKEENRKLKGELKDARLELGKRESPEKSKVAMESMKQKLQQTETLCEELMEENEEIKKEVKDLEQELEELHDNFREDQASEFRGLKKEVETATKNCRVLQFKLRKTEKRCEQLELERHGLEDRVREFQSASRLDVDRAKMKDLERELKLSREMTSSMDSEIQILKDAVKRAESENETLRCQSGTRSVTPTTQFTLPPGVKDSLLGKDYESLAHELYDTMERENDLREQFRFCEDEAKVTRRKLNALEQENETLMLQMKKLTARIKNDRSGKNEEEEDQSPENLKINLEFMEQEMVVMRRKLEDTEKENENLQSEVKYLQEKVINQPLIEVPELPKDNSSPSAYWGHKVRLLEYEVRETRKKLIEKEREIERLHTEVEIYRKKASKVMVRSRSLDSDIQVDLKRQLQLVEQEASMLRQKVATLETENEKLGTENKRMTLRLSKKPPLTSSDMVHLENLELKQRMEEQDRKMSAMKDELEKCQRDPVSLIQDYKTWKDVPTDNENDLISSLKKRMKAKEEEMATLQGKMVQLEVDNSRLSRDYRKLKDTIGNKKKPAKAVRDTATRIELREVVSELQDEISELQVSLRSREVIQEGLEEELERCKKEVVAATKELKQKESRFEEELISARMEQDTFRQDVTAHKSKIATLEGQLKEFSKQTGSDVDHVKKIKDLKAEKLELERRARAAEESLEKKTSRLRDTQEKLNATTVLKDEMARSNRMLEGQKMDLQKEVDEHRELLKKAEERASDLRSQIEKTDRDLTSLRKECNQLRNELEDERTKLRHTDNRQSEVTVSWAKEREDLRRTINELRNKIENLQQQIAHNEEIYVEKESRLRDDHKKKKDSAVREAREKVEAELQLVREEEKITKTKLLELGEKLEKAESALREASEKSRHTASHHRREKDDWQAQRHELEGQMRSEVKRRERIEREMEQLQKNRDEELLQTRDKVVALEREQRKSLAKISELEEQQSRVLVLEKDAERSRQEYDDLTSKYDQLEEEFVKVKSRLVAEKEQVEADLFALKQDYNQVNLEMTSVKTTFNSKQDSWITEKLDLQEKVKEKDTKLQRLNGWEQEKLQLKDTVEEKNSLIESYRKEEKHLKEERERLRKRVEELNKSMEVQRSDRQTWLSTTGTTRAAADGIRETHDMRIRLEHIEKCHQSDMADQKADYEGRMALMSSEITSMQSQIAKLATERDKYKTQLGSAEKNVEEIRTGSLKRERARHKEEADMARRKVQELRNQLEDVREQMDDILLENKNLKLQIETDKNTWEIQMSELKSKINQLEEQKLLESTRGQTRNFAKTRLELAWEKERGDLQHVLSDTQQLVSDLKTRLEAAESDREKEKQSTRRQITDMRSSMDKERQDHRRKMTELHSNLLDLRESHAKLRGMYDRMKKEREILISEREEWRQKLHVAYELTSKINDITDDVQKVSNSLEAKKSGQEVQENLTQVQQRLTQLQKVASSLKEDEKFKRNISFRRAVSAQEVSRPQLSDPSQRWMNPQRVTNYPVAPPSMIIRPPPRLKALHRKSLSLDQSLGAQDMLKIWESECESGASTPSGSLLSLKMRTYGYESDTSLPDSEYRYGSLQMQRRYYLRTPVMTDSEVPSSREGSVGHGSIGSVESVPTVTTQKRSSTLKDKLKLLRRTKSIDVANQGGLGSSTKSQKEEKEKSLRSKISKVLRKPLGRSSSVDNPKPTLPPKGLVPDVIPQRPTAQKPLSSSRGDLSSGRSSKSHPGRKTPEVSSRPKSPPSDGATKFETPV